jgi:hypothetical protein
MRPTNLDRAKPMHRLSVLLLCCSLAVTAAVVTAAPAPLPVASRPWVAGWDKPVDPVGDCRFDRRGERLTITVPGPNHGLDLDYHLHQAPGILRWVQGDFTFQVRLNANCLPAGDRGVRSAGVVLVAGQSRAILRECVSLPLPLGAGAVLPRYLSVQAGFFPGHGRSATIVTDSVTPIGKTVSLCLMRRGQSLLMRSSPDGKQWRTLTKEFLKLPPDVQVGVFAESTAEGTFKAVFDRFTLTTP